MHIGCAILGRAILAAAMLLSLPANAATVFEASGVAKFYYSHYPEANDGYCSNVNNRVLSCFHDEWEPGNIGAVYASLGVPATGVNYRLDWSLDRPLQAGEWFAVGQGLDWWMESYYRNPSHSQWVDYDYWPLGTEYYVLEGNGSVIFQNSTGNFTRERQLTAFELEDVVSGYEGVDSPEADSWRDCQNPGGDCAYVEDEYWGSFGLVIFGHVDSDLGYSVRMRTLYPGQSIVPEPATWTMLIAGFGMIGLAARRRRDIPVRFPV